MSDVTPEMRDLAPAYALGALDAEEARAFEAAMAMSPELRQEVAEYRELNAVLAAGQAAPPTAALRGRLLDRVRSEKVVPLAGRKPPIHTAAATAPKSVTNGNESPMIGSSAARRRTAPRRMASEMT